VRIRGQNVSVVPSGPQDGFGGLHQHRLLVSADTTRTRRAP
jgi:hypothetical protein